MEHILEQLIQFVSWAEDSTTSMIDGEIIL